MDSKIDPIIMNGSNYAVWAPDMENMFKSKGPWKYTKVVILDPTDSNVFISVDLNSHIWSGRS
jgi:hypothetical protein